MSLTELHCAAVDAFPASPARKQLWRSLLDFTDAMRDLICTREIWIGGSFVTREENPRDIDAVVVLDPEQFIEDVNCPDRERLYAILDEVRWSERGVDVDYVFDGDSRWLWFWLGALGFERDERTPRGICVLPLRTADAIDGCRRRRVADARTDRQGER